MSIERNKEYDVDSLKYSRKPVFPNSSPSSVRGAVRTITDTDSWDITLIWYRVFPSVHRDAVYTKIDSSIQGQCCGFVCDYVVEHWKSSSRFVQNGFASIIGTLCRHMTLWMNEYVQEHTLRPKKSPRNVQLQKFSNYEYKVTLCSPRFEHHFLF